MGIPVLVLGESGTGKSCSLRNFKSDEVGIFNIAGKILPFKHNFVNILNSPNYETIIKCMCHNGNKIYVVDDSQYLMAFELFNKAKERGYDKFTDIAVNFKQLIDASIKGTSPDTIVYFLHHTEVNEQGKIKIKTVGKMLDQQLTLEGLFSIVLRTNVEQGKYTFYTRNNGNDTCKSPMGMFEEAIENDLKFVDTTIREYMGVA